MYLDGWFSDVLKFKAFEGKKVLGAIAKDPTRLITGVDPASTHVWNVALGTHNKALVDQWGGTTQETAQAAKAAGINIGPGMTMEAIAHVVASYFAGAGLAKAMPQGDTMLQIAEKLKTAADSRGGIGPQYQQADCLPPGDAAIQTWAPGNAPPTTPPRSSWLAPAAVGVALVKLLTLI